MFMAIFAPPLSTPTTVWPAAPFVLTLTQSWLPGSDYLNAFNGVSWSLSCEAFFYLLFPFLVGLLSRIARLTRFSAGLYFTMSALAMAAFLSIPIPVANYLLGTTPLYRLGEFVLGVSLALLIKRGWRPRFGLLQAVILSATLYGSLFVISSTTVGDPGSLPVAWANLIMMPGFLAIIAATSASDLNENNAILGSRPMVRLGQWSFALYLVHELVIRCMRPLVVGLNVGAAVVASAVVIAIALALSGVLHEFVERPVEKLLRSSRVRSKPSTAPVPEETSR
jgi:peptidoglycan/LPS O-acetylase OafA/YrhL